MVEIPRDLYPFTGHYLPLAGGRMHYLDEGSGEPVVMLHGNPTWSFYYRNLVRELRGRYRVIAPDHMGCGLSDKPADAEYDYTLSRRVEDIDALLNHAGVTGGITLVLHDWGGMIGMTWAARNPGRVKRLVLLNTGAFPLPPEKSFPLGLRICRDTAFGGWLVRRFNAFSSIASRIGTKRRPLSPPVRRALVAPYNSWENRIATLRFVQDIPLKPGDRGYDIIKDTESKLALFRDRPCFIGWGEKDFVFDLHLLAVWRRHFPQAEVLSFPDCGHYILEDAAEELIPAISRFLEKTK